MACSRPKHRATLKDEVYRQMFRLEAEPSGCRNGPRDCLVARMDCLWTRQAQAEEDREWLRKVSPNLSQMIEERAGEPERRPMHSVMLASLERRA